jgi:PAS domain S-box-containing protein
MIYHMRTSSSLSGPVQSDNSLFSLLCGAALVLAYIFNASVSILYLSIFILSLSLFFYIDYELKQGRFYFLGDYLFSILLTVLAIAISIFTSLSILLLVVPVFTALLKSRRMSAFLLPSIGSLIFGIIYLNHNGIFHWIIWATTLTTVLILNKYLTDLFNLQNDQHKQLEALKLQSERNLHLVTQMTEGRFEESIQFEADDELSKNLYNLGLELKRNAEAEKIRNWQNTGFNEVNSILRSSSDYELIYKAVLSFIIKHINANQGGLFTIVEERSQKYIEMKACYAYEKQRMHQVRRNVDEGLLGQAIADGDLMYLEVIPENYVHITSGLGLAKPRALVICPLKLNGEVFGVLELASFDKFSKHQLDFIVKVGEIIGGSISFNQKTTQTSQMLIESRQLAEELNAQKEELRQNMEELEATQEHLNREAKVNEKLKKDIERSKEFLNLVIDTVPIPVFVKDRDHRMVLLNKAVCDLNKKTRDQMLGKTDYDFFKKEEADVFWNFEEEIFTRKTSAEKVEQSTRDGKEVYTLDKKNYVSTDSGEDFLVGINIDITYAKMMERNMSTQGKN